MLSESGEDERGNTSNAGAMLMPAAIQSRIEDERRRLLIEQNLEHDLAGQRLAPLEAGDDVALDRVEGQINQCRDRQFRIQERITLLEARHLAAVDAATSAQLDALAARADRARAYGERLIADYAKRAPEVASLVARMAAVEGIIEESNAILHKAGRAGVLSPNVVRCRQGRHWTEKVMRDVDLTHPAHPYHGRAAPMGGISTPGNFVRRMANIEGQSGGTCPVVVNVEVEEQRSDPGDFPDPIFETAFLPGVGPAELGHGIQPLWADGVSRSGTALAAVLAEIDTPPKLSKRA
jgi:hypothetical protein